MPCPSSVVDFELLRCQMVEQQLLARGINDPGVLRAMARIPREVFVPDEYRPDAYKDGPLPIGSGQTISQPYMVALMTELARLDARDTVLEVGTGSGYQCAVLQTITPRVYSIERIDFLVQKANMTLRSIGCDTMTIRAGDGSLGWPEKAPFDAIIVTAGAPDIPETLKAQLADGGRLVIPAGPRHMQTLYCVERRRDDFFTKQHTDCVFVPMIGACGWNDQP